MATINNALTWTKVTFALHDSSQEGFKSDESACIKGREISQIRVILLNVALSQHESVLMHHIVLISHAVKCIFSGKMQH